MKKQKLDWFAIIFTIIFTLTTAIFSQDISMTIIVYLLSMIYFK